MEKMKEKEKKDNGNEEFKKSKKEVKKSKIKFEKKIFYQYNQ